MGNKTTSSIKISEYKEDLKVLNKVCSNDLFLRKTGYLLNFKPKKENLFDDIFDVLPSVNVEVVSKNIYV